MRIFGGDQIAGMMTRFNFPEDQPLTHGLVTRVLEQAQVKVEGFNFESRKKTLDYDDVLNKQREIIYSRRRKILEGKENPTELMMQKVNNVIERSVAFNLDVNQDQGGYDKIIEDFMTVANFDDQSQKQLISSIEGKDAQSTVNFLYNLVEKIQTKREEEFGKDNINQIMKAIALQTSDNLWMDHLTSIDDLRTGIGLRGFAQRDPIVEYKKEAFKLFENLMTAIDDEIVHRAFRVNIQVQHNHAPHTHANEGITNQPEAEIGAEGVAKIKEKAKKVEQKHKQEANSQRLISSAETKIGRNDPCPCGSGLKYKKCGLINSPQHKG
jgi:preprotein translocase subunit SecA